MALRAGHLLCVVSDGVPKESKSLWTDAVLDNTSPVQALLRFKSSVGHEDGSNPGHDVGLHKVYRYPVQFAEPGNEATHRVPI